MSEGKYLTDLLNGAPTVTTLASEDRLAVVNGQGELEKISRANLMNQDTAGSFYASANSAGRWIRIAEMNNYGSACMLTVSAGGYNAGWCYPLTVLITAPHGDSPQHMSVTPLSPKAATHVNVRYPFSKLRLTGDDATKYVELFVSHAASQTLRFVLGCAVYARLITPVENPATARVLKEFVTSDLWEGGGNWLFHNKLRNLAERRVA